MLSGILFATEVPVPEKDHARRKPAAFTIVTPHAREAGLLLERVHELFSPLLDECIGHDFFDRLGEAAVEYSCYVEKEAETAENLLKIIVTEARDILDEMIAGEFPYITSSEEGAES